MLTSAARPPPRQIASGWRRIRRWSISPAVNTARATSCFAGLTCLVCVAERRFVNCGKRRVGEMMKKKSALESSIFVLRAKPWLRHCLLPKLPQTEQQEQHVEDQQAEQHRHDRQMRKLRY